MLTILIQKDPNSLYAIEGSELYWKTVYFKDYEHYNEFWETETSDRRTQLNLSVEVTSLEEDSIFFKNLREGKGEWVTLIYFTNEKGMYSMVQVLDKDKVSIKNNGGSVIASF